MKADFGRSLNEGRSLNSGDTQPFGGTGHPTDTAELRSTKAGV